ncbi:MAG: SUMF1/EgtB/PvdO family nonheme iron enzyme [Anaerolineae bacterium]
MAKLFALLLVGVVLIGCTATPTAAPTATSMPTSTVETVETAATAAPTLEPTTQSQSQSTADVTAEPTLADTPTIIVPPAATSSPRPTVVTLTPIATIAPQATFAATLENNEGWQPQSQTFDGVEMVLVPAGCFKMGSDAGSENEKPVHQQCVEQAFYIDRYEVTNDQFERLGGSAGTPNYWNDPKRPREQITWLEANAFCALRGSRLPTEAEWEYAARGPESLTYPWGNSFVADNVVYSGNIEFETAEVGSKPGGVSWVGALDMSGNVWEWVSSRPLPYPYVATDGREDSEKDNTRVLRGGSWSDPDTGVTTTARYEVTATDLSGNFGFRCARDS